MSRFDGATNQPAAGTFGAKSTIELDPASLCGSDGIGSSTWTMIAVNWNTGGGSGNDTQGYAQSGYGNFGSGDGDGVTGSWEFAQALAECGPVVCYYPDTYYGTHPTGTEIYSASYRSSDGGLHMLAGGTSLGVTTWNPLGYWPPKWQVQMLAETKYLGSDVSGVPSDPVSYTENMRATSSSGDWVDIANSSLLDDHPCRYRRQQLAPATNDNFKIWTEPLASKTC
jgi:hypothetical protein